MRIISSNLQEPYSEGFWPILAGEMNDSRPNAARKPFYDGEIANTGYSWLSVRRQSVHSRLHLQR